MPINWNVRALRGRPKYQNVYLAYLDILGFKNLMEKHAQDSPHYIARLFQKIDGVVQHPRISGLVQRYLSDSILIWCTHPASLPFMFDVCHFLQDELLREGCLIRGAIVSGQHYNQYFDQVNMATGERDKKSGEILISPALVKAYRIESSLSEPVIMVEGSVAIAEQDLYKGLPRGHRPPAKKLKRTGLYNLPSYLLTPRFGLLRAALSRADRPSKEWQTHPGVKDAITTAKKMRVNILEGLKNRDPRIRRKWQYVKKVFNWRVRPLVKKWDLARGLPL